MKPLWICAAVLPLAACATTVSDVTPVGNNTYSVVANASAGGISSAADVKAAAVKRANEFCATKGKRAEVIMSHANGTPLWTPQSSDVQFMCMAE